MNRNITRPIVHADRYSFLKGNCCIPKNKIEQGIQPVWNIDIVHRDGTLTVTCRGGRRKGETMRVKRTDVLVPVSQKDVWYSVV